MRALCFLAALALSIAPPSFATEIKPFDRGTLAEIVARHSGQPFIINYWSIDCPPCYKELTIWASLKRRYPTLAIILVATDGMEQLDSVTATLAERGVGQLESWLFASQDVSRLRYEIDRHWYGELPRTYFYSATGERLGVSGLVREPEVERWIEHNRRNAATGATDRP